MRNHKKWNIIHLCYFCR